MADEETPRAKSQAEVERVVQLIIENWEAIGVQEGPDGILHLPAAIKRRDKTGAVKAETVYLRNISNPQRFKSRIVARQWAQELELDLERDADLVDLLENYEILSYAVRDDQFIQHVPDGKTLWKKYDVQSLGELWGTYDAWVRMLHPSFGTWDAEKLWKVIARVKAGSTVTPLAGMPGIEQSSCIVFMAREACNSPNAPSWLQSSGTSTRPPSRSTS